MDTNKNIFYTNKVNAGGTCTSQKQTNTKYRYESNLKSSSKPIIKANNKSCI